LCLSLFWFTLPFWFVLARLESYHNNADW
jgi:hypothetical protein